MESFLGHSGQLSLKASVVTVVAVVYTVVP